MTNTANIRNIPVDAYVLFTHRDGRNGVTVRNRRFTVSEMTLTAAAKVASYNLLPQYALVEVIAVFPATEIGRKRAAEIKRAYKAGEWKPEAVAQEPVQEMETVETLAESLGEMEITESENTALGMKFTHAIETLDSVFA